MDAVESWCGRQMDTSVIDPEVIIDALERAEVVDGVVKMSNQFRDIVVSMLKYNISNQVKLGSYILTSPDINVAFVYKKICEDLIANHVLLVDTIDAPGERAYSWTIKAVQTT